MTELPRLEARIASLRELRELMRAMRALAAGHLQESLQALDGVRTYASIIEAAIARCAQLLPQPAAASDTGSPARGAVVLALCSEHGFVGAFNGAVLVEAKRRTRAGALLHIVGRRGVDLAGARGHEIASVAAMATHIAGVPALARQIAADVAEAGSLLVIYARYDGGMRHAVETRSVLPLDPKLLEAAAGSPPPFHHLPPDLLLARLAEEYVTAELTRLLIESLASENAARLRVMDAADRNIDEDLTGLTRLEREARQEAVTTELLDVVTGAMAIAGRT